MLMEVMGLHLPGAAFVHPHSDLRHALTTAATHHAASISLRSVTPRPIGKCLDARSFANAIVGLHATGGSTNHTLHLPAMAAAAGIDLRWQDFADLSDIVPLLARIYPNGQADVNHFHAAGGMGFVISELLAAGLLDGSAATIWGKNLADYAVEPKLEKDGLVWSPAEKQTHDASVLRGVTDPHAPTGGLKMLEGNLGRSVIKVSAVSADRHKISAPALVFETEAQVKQAFVDGQLEKDCIVVVRGQGPQACGMPELHSLTPLLATLQDKGFAVALVTDGRMSGASGTVPAAIHLCPEAVKGGPIGKIRDGDMLTLDAVSGILTCQDDLSERILLSPITCRRQALAEVLQPCSAIRQVMLNRGRPCRADRSPPGDEPMTILDILKLGPVMPVIVIDSADQAEPLADALLAGGIRTAEITLRTPAAIKQSKRWPATVRTSR